ncbi:MAG: hypothetical protein QNJ98_14025 [Planctomycetota bacterium]|nr:hypothetical protein [Planctomycetota bacterium]
MNPLSTLRSVLRPLALTAVFGASIALAGCGGGGGGEEEDDQVVIQQVTIESTAELDGVVFGDNLDVNASSTLPPHVGDGPAQATGGAQRAHGIYSFDLSGLPAGAVIRSAKLRLAVDEVTNNPNAAMALVLVDHVNFGAIFPQSFGMLTLDTGFAQITDIDVVGAKELDVTEQVQDDMDSNRTRSQYRLRGAVDSDFDDDSDLAKLSDADGTTASEPPALILEIELPATN